MTAEQVRIILLRDLQKNYTDASGKPSQKTMALAIGITPSHLSELLRAKREPAGKVLEYLKMERVVSYRALVTLQ